MNLSLYQCPKTRQELRRRSQGLLVSADGTESYPIQRGMVDFRVSRSRETPANDGLLRLLEMARADGSAAALKATFPDTRYLDDSSRAAYLDLLPLDKNKAVLEIGSSLGQHTKLIAARVGSVEALEVVPEQASFAKFNCEEIGLRNVNVTVGGDGCRLPYRNSAFDLVIMNYVFEWSAARSGMSPEAAHRLLLHECKRVLRPGGTLFLSTKNRFNLRLIIGRIDEHVGFRFGNALPRSLMVFLSKMLRNSQSWGYLHSYGALQRMLVSTGFINITARLALPDARYPRVYSGFGKPELAILRAREELISSRLTRFLLTAVPGNMIKWIAPSLVFIAERGRQSGDVP